MFQVFVNTYLPWTSTSLQYIKWLSNTYLEKVVILFRNLTTESLMNLHDSLLPSTLEIMQAQPLVGVMNERQKEGYDAWIFICLRS